MNSPWPLQLPGSWYNGVDMTSITPTYQLSNNHWIYLIHCLKSNDYLVISSYSHQVIQITTIFLAEELPHMIVHRLNQGSSLSLPLRSPPTPSQTIQYNTAACHRSKYHSSETDSCHNRQDFWWHSSRECMLPLTRLTSQTITCVLAGYEVNGPNHY